MDREDVQTFEIYKYIIKMVEFKFVSLNNINKKLDLFLKF
jgi:hypothetical protein